MLTAANTFAAMEIVVFKDPELAKKEGGRSSFRFTAPSPPHRRS
jgi:hypothetical protein